MALEDFDPDILNDFLTESGELLDELDADLVTLEETPDDEDLLNRIFRALHTIKGSASFLAITNLVNFAHAAEDALNVIRKGEVVVDERVMDAMLKSVDILRRQLEQVEASEDPEAGPEALIEILHAIAEKRSLDQGEHGSEGLSESVDSVDVASQVPDADEDESVTSDTPPSSESETDVETDSVSSDDRVATVAEQPLELPGSKADLLEFMVDDLRECLDHLDEQIEQLNDPEHRQEVIETIAESAEALGRSVDFFELEDATSLVSLFEIAGDHLSHVEEHLFSQIYTRLQAVLYILRQMTDGLSRSAVLSFPISTLGERLVDLLLGNDIADEAVLPPASSVEHALKIDGVVIDQATGDLPSSEVVPGVSCDSAESQSDEIPQESSDAPVCEDTDDSVSQPDQGKPKSVDAVSQDSTSAEKTTQSTKPSNMKSSATIRVEVERLENLQNLVGELVIQKNRISALSRQIVLESGVNSALREEIGVAASDLDRATSDIQGGVMRTRMQPLNKLFGKYPRMMRDLARSTDKQINLVIEGGDTEVDKSIIEKLGDPMVHILRNSADHGIEPPDVRAQNGKSEVGTVTISAAHQGGYVLIMIRDDGSGLNRERIGAKAIERGMVTAEELVVMSDKEVMGLVMAPGFSMAQQVSDLSGRGVGMDVVRTNIQKLGGQIDLDSVENEGTTLSITIPLTVAILSAMMVSIGPEMYAIPLTNIKEIVRPEQSQVSTIHGHPVMQLRDTVLPLISMVQQYDVMNSHTDEDCEEPFTVVVEAGDQQVGLMVTRLIGQQEIVIKPLDEDIEKSESISGATIRDDGGVSLILDVVKMIEHSGASIRRVAA